MSHAYRSAYEHIIGARVAGMRAARASLEPLVPMLRTVRDARIARIVAGAVGIFGGTAMVLAAAMPPMLDAPLNELPTEVLVGSTLAAIAAYVVARAAAYVLPFSLPKVALPRLTGELDADLARLDAADDSRALRARLDRLEVASIATPMIGMTMLTPLFLHYLFVLACDSTGGYSHWIQISLIIVGHAHLALMGLCYGYARKLKRLPYPELEGLSVLQEWSKTLGIVVLVSSVPGLILFAVPPILSAITGLAFIPAMFIVARRLLLKERALLAMAELSTPAMVRVEADELVGATEEYASEPSLEPAPKMAAHASR